MLDVWKGKLKLKLKLNHMMDTHTRGSRCGVLALNSNKQDLERLHPQTSMHCSLCTPTTADYVGNQVCYMKKAIICMYRYISLGVRLMAESTYI